MSSEKYIGLDVHQATISVAVMVFLAAAEKTDHTNCLGRPIKRIPDQRMAIFTKSFRCFACLQRYSCNHADHLISVGY
ncbi:MAG: hypothetical protein WB384_07845 [Candidatus Sulfotelmatobacter sp.]